MDTTQLKVDIKKLYLEGKSRKEAMEACNISTNQMASQSTQLNLHWSWPLANRQSGQAPVGYQPKTIYRAAAGTRSKPRATSASPTRTAPFRPPAAAKAQEAPPKPEPVAEDEPAPVLPRRRHLRVTGWVPSAEKRRRGLADMDTPHIGSSEAERYLYSKLYG